MKNYNLKAIKQQAGMTLIELTVVLLVLVGLAGLTIPYISGFVGKTHNATSADSGASLFNSLQLYAVTNNGLPNGLNVLTSSATSAGIIPNYLDNNFVNTQTSATTLATITPVNFGTVTGSAAILGSLNAANFTTATALSATNFSYANSDGTYGFSSGGSATFDPEITAAAITATTNFVSDTAGGKDYTTANYAGGQNTSISGVLGYKVPTNHVLIVLGVGQSNAAIGKTLSSVPVHFGDKGSLQPTYTYSRFLAAVDVDTSGQNAPAKIVGIVHAPDIGDKWESLFSSISGYYKS